MKRLLFLLITWKCQQKSIERTSLKAASPIPVGSAISSKNLMNDSTFQNILNQEFSSITAENEMKMKWLQPEEGVFVWENADYIVNWALESGKQVHGHTLIWHEATPEWVKKYDGDSARLEQIMKNHIQTVVRHYKGRVRSWDVINETIENGSGNWRKTIWYNNLGPGYLSRAHQYAHEADPDVLLFFNEYSLESDTAKLQGAVKVVDDMLTNNIPIHGIGFQFHTQIGKPPYKRFEEIVQMFADKGLKIHFSELDICVNGNVSEGAGINTFEKDLAEAQRVRYRQFAELMNEVPHQQRYAITTWGFTDKYTWIRGYFKKMDWPLLFDEEYNKKPAYFGFLEGLKNINQ